MPHEQSRPPRVPHATLARRLTEALAARGMSLVTLRDRLEPRGHRIALSTLSYWRSGQRRPESPRLLDALSEIEDILDLPRDHLRASLGPTRRRGPDSLQPFDVQVGNPGDLDEFKRAHELDEPHGLSLRSLDCHIYVDERGWVVESVQRSGWRASVDGVASALVPFKLDQSGVPEPGVHALAGCTLGATYFDQESGLLAAELRLDRALSIGETTMTEHSFTGRFGIEQDVHWAVVPPRRCHHVSLWVRFHPAKLPRRCLLQVWTDEATLVERELACIDGGVSHVEEGFGPGTLQISWTWG